MHMQVHVGACQCAPWHAAMHLPCHAAHHTRTPWQAAMHLPCHAIHHSRGPIVASLCPISHPSRAETLDPKVPDRLLPPISDPAKIFKKNSFMSPKPPACAQASSQPPFIFYLCLFASNCSLKAHGNSKEQLKKINFRCFFVTMISLNSPPARAPTHCSGVVPWSGPAVAAPCPGHPGRAETRLLLPDPTQAGL